MSQIPQLSRLELGRADLAAAVVSEIERAGGSSITFGSDLAEEQVVLRMFDEAERRFGGVDVVVANAADVVIKPFVDLTVDDYEQLFAANVTSAFLTLRQAARRVRDEGRIIATSTGGTRMFFTETGLQLGTKGAVEQFVRVLAGPDARWVTGQNVAAGGGVA